VKVEQGQLVTERAEQVEQQKARLECPEVSADFVVLVQSRARIPGKEL
jgi:hypothetical protein